MKPLTKEQVKTNNRRCSMKLLFALFGPSGSGKSTYRDKLKEKGYEVILSHTDRAIREGEQDGVDYYFKQSMEGEVFEQSTTGNHNYWTTQEQIDFEGTRIIILDPPGLEQYKQKFDGKVVGVYLECDVYTRTIRLQKTSTIREVFGRIKRDKDKFNYFKTDYIVNAGRSIEEVLEDIEKIIHVEQVKRLDKNIKEVE